MLSEHPRALIHVPLFDAEAPLGREQLEELAEPVLARTVAACQEVRRVAGEPDLAAIFLTGGMSRMPAVTTALHRAFGLVPTSVDQPELAVAEGSVRTAGAATVELDPAWPPVEFTPPAPPRRRWSAIVAAGAGVLALVVVAGIAYAHGGPSKPAPVAPSGSPATAASATGGRSASAPSRSSTSAPARR